MITLTELQTRILEALAQYRYLTHSQMLRLQIGSASFIRHSTRRLREKGDLIASIKYPFAPQQGRLEQVHHLTPAGATILSEIQNDESLEQHFRPVTAVYHRDYFHRKATIDFQIALTMAMSQHEQLELAAFHRYFDKTGANRSNSKNTLRSHTRVDLTDTEHLIPDANFLLHRAGDTNHQVLYTVEIANGHDAKRNLRQIQRHAALLKRGALSKKYGLTTNSPHQVLFIFSDYGLFQAVRSRFTEVEQAHPYSACFRFGYLPYLLKDPFRCWKLPPHVSDDWHHLITGKPVKTDSEANETALSTS